MTWLDELKKGDYAMILYPHMPPKKRKVTSACVAHVTVGGMEFYRKTGTTIGCNLSIGPVPQRLVVEEPLHGDERMYLATRVRNASTHELTLDQLRRMVAILDEQVTNDA